VAEDDLIAGVPEAWLRGDLDVLDATGRRRNLEPVFEQASQVQFYRPANRVFDLRDRVARRHAAR